MRLTEPDVGDHAVRGRRRQRVAHLAGQGADGGAAEAGVGALERLGQRAGRAVDGPGVQRPLQPLGRAAVADHLDVVQLLARRLADRAADQAGAEDRDPHQAGAAASRRARTEAARPSSTSTVVSQAMQASVIDWP